MMGINIGKRVLLASPERLLDYIIIGGEEYDVLSEVPLVDHLVYDDSRVLLEELLGRPDAEHVVSTAHPGSSTYVGSYLGGLKIA